MRIFILLSLILFNYFFQGNSCALEKTVKDSRIQISELCIIPDEIGFPSWIEIKYLLNGSLSLKDYYFTDGTKLLYKFDQNMEISSNGFMIISFYENNKPSKEFEKLIPNNVKIINIFNSSLFKEQDALPTDNSYYGITKEDISYFASREEEAKKEGSTSISEHMKHIPKLLYEKYENMAGNYCAKNNISSKYKDILVLS